MSQTAPSSAGLDLERVGRTLEAYLAQAGVALTLRDRATGQEHQVERALARSPDGLLPVFLAAGEAVWREATGKPGFGLDVRPDPASLFGRRLHRVGSASFATVMLATVEAVEQARGPGVLVVNDLRAQWAAAQPYLPTKAAGATAGAGALP